MNLTCQCYSKWQRGVPAGGLVSVTSPASNRNRPDGNGKRKEKEEKNRGKNMNMGLPT